MQGENIESDDDDDFFYPDTSDNKQHKKMIHMLLLLQTGASLLSGTLRPPVFCFVRGLICILKTVNKTSSV